MKVHVHVDRGEASVHNWLSKKSRIWYLSYTGWYLLPWSTHYIADSTYKHCHRSLFCLYLVVEQHSLSLSLSLRRSIYSIFTLLRALLVSLMYGNSLINNCSIIVKSILIKNSTLNPQTPNSFPQNLIHLPVNRWSKCTTLSYWGCKTVNSILGIGQHFAKKIARLVQKTCTSFPWLGKLAWFYLGVLISSMTCYLML